MVTICLAWCLLGSVAADPPVHADKPNAVVFPTQDARFVRLVIHGSSSGEPCIDELEVYGPDRKANLALADRGAKAAASSCLRGYAQHAIEHLNDGLYGNDHSWIAASAGTEWAQIELPAATKVSQGRFLAGPGARSMPTGCRSVLKFGFPWTASSGRRSKRWRPGRLPWRCAGGQRASGRRFRTRLRRRGPIPAATRRLRRAVLRYAFLGEEHAWLKTYGRADISPRLVPYNGRVKEYPRHVGDDRLPLAPLSSRPKLDGNLDDACWSAASRGVVRVASPDDFDRGPLAYVRRDGRLARRPSLPGRLDRPALEQPRGRGLPGRRRRRAAWWRSRDKGLVFNTYEPDGRRRREAEAIDAAGRGDGRVAEPLRVPPAAGGVSGLPDAGAPRRAGHGRKTHGPGRPAGAGSTSRRFRSPR